MSVHIEGFDELGDEIEELRHRAESIDGSNEIPMDELFTDDFMRSYTDFETLESFFEFSPWEVESKKDFKELPQKDFDKYVDATTGFDDWETMLQAAGREWVVRQLKLS